MSDASPISLKVKLEEDIRRFSVSRDITYVDLRNLVAKHFALAPENVHLKYVDDEEELITLGSDLELQEAKRLQPTVLRLNAYAKSSKGTAAPQEPSLEAQFMRDVTVPDSTSVSAGVRFEKVWRVKNSGPVSWPAGVLLKMVDPSDNHLLVLAVGAIKRAVAPGEETDIGVELQAPSRPGRCHQHWRLFTPDGEAFGPRLWIEIMVTISKESAQQTEAEVRQKEQERLEAERLEQELAVKKMEEEELERRRLEEALELQRQALEEEKRRRDQEEEDEIRRQEEAAAAAEEARKIQEEEKERQRQEEEAAAAAAAAAAERLRCQQEEEAEMARKEQERRQEEERKKKEEEEKAQQLFRKYPSQLVALTEMGFSDLERNVQLLDRHKGSLDLALEALLSATN